MDKKKWLMVIAVVLVLAVLAVLYGVFINSNIKSSVVKNTYNGSRLDGCDGFELENGDKINTFCFWGDREKQTMYEAGSINVGDTVEYGTEESGRQFIRLKKAD